MTVVAGVLCSDGVVIGTDSSATFIAGQAKTVEQPCKKITIVDELVIVAGTGSIGLGQRFVSVVEKLSKEKLFSNNSEIEVSKKICKSAIDDFIFTHAPGGTFGALVAFPCQ
ncbi:MAG: hypothetical protein JRC92_09090, partial [Deltaproteobacteria bacterium]|nr:hypothetical protein [Deltaproteobacteria bacterium]